MSVYYNKISNKLIIQKSQANDSYWDSHWDKIINENKIKDVDNFVRKTTSKYLAPGSKILEGGCGIGNKVYTLDKYGYDAYGVDYAQSTVNKVNEILPALKISYGDVRKLQYENNFFDGYWSVGVIEHFWNGYNKIAKEMSRVIKAGGFLFLTFPSISKLRKLKIYLNCYESKKDLEEPNDFYQFILNSNSVVESFEKFRFIPVDRVYFDALKGIKDEMKIFNPVFQKIYDSKSLYNKCIRKIFENVFSQITGHSCLIVFKKI
ncbi:MAG TPA: class I SAM-dependent methyltransferase [Victivallales bacterium]|nr:class I SAM-dependent methyltransferase [Victivallales bacterium]